VEIASQHARRYLYMIPPPFLFHDFRFAFAIIVYFVRDLQFVGVMVSRLGTRVLSQYCPFLMGRVDDSTAVGELEMRFCFIF